MLVPLLRVAALVGSGLKVGEYDADEGEGGGGALLSGEGSWVHWAFSNSSDWICLRSSSFSAVVAVMDSAWFSWMESVRNEGEDRESVPVVVGVEVWRLASIIVPNETKLPSSRELPLVLVLSA